MAAIGGPVVVTVAAPQPDLHEYDISCPKSLTVASAAALNGAFGFAAFVGGPRRAGTTEAAVSDEEWAQVHAVNAVVCCYGQSNGKPSAHVRVWNAVTHELSRELATTGVAARQCLAPAHSASPSSAPDAKAPAVADAGGDDAASAGHAAVRAVADTALLLLRPNGLEMAGSGRNLLPAVPPGVGDGRFVCAARCGDGRAVYVACAAASASAPVVRGGMYRVDVAAAGRVAHRQRSQTLQTADRKTAASDEQWFERLTIAPYAPARALSTCRRLAMACHTRAPDSEAFAVSERKLWLVRLPLNAAAVEQHWLDAAGVLHTGWLLRPLWRAVASFFARDTVVPIPVPLWCSAHDIAVTRRGHVLCGTERHIIAVNPHRMPLHPVDAQHALQSKAAPATPLVPPRGRALGEEDVTCDSPVPRLVQRIAGFWQPHGTGANDDDDDDDDGDSDASDGDGDCCDGDGLRASRFGFISAIALDVVRRALYVADVRRRQWALRRVERLPAHLFDAPEPLLH